MTEPARNAIVTETGEKVVVTQTYRGWATIEGSSKKLRTNTLTFADPVAAAPPPPAPVGFPEPSPSSPRRRRKKEADDNLEPGEVLENEDDKPIGMVATLNRYKPRYATTTAYSGARSQNNGDELAGLLAGATPSDVCAAADRIFEFPVGTHSLRYASLNPGQRRMNSGNRIRAAVRRGDCTTDDVAKALLG